MISSSTAYQTANAKLARRPIFIITISDYYRVFSNRVLSSEFLASIPGIQTEMDDWLVGIEDQQITVNDLDGGADLADLIFTVQDRGNAITADFPGFVFEGKTVQLLIGYDGLAYADYVPLFTGRIDSVESTENNLNYVFTCPDARTDLNQSIFPLGDDGQKISSDHPLTVNGHPLDILLDILRVECGYVDAEIDVAKIEAYRDGLYSGAQMQFTLSDSPTAKDFIESELLKPMAAYMRTNNVGQITVEFAYPNVLTMVYDFTPDNLVEIPAAGQADLIDEVVVRMDVDADSGKFLQQSVKSYQPAIDKYGLFGQQIIESQGLRSGLNGFFLAMMTSFLIFMRYGSKALCHGSNGKNSSSNPINALWNAALVEPGDFVTITHPLVPDRAAGTVGITAKPYVVMDRTWQFWEGLVQFKLIELNLTKFQLCEIAPTGHADYMPSSSTDKARYMFMCNDSDQYSNGDPANTLS